MKNDWLRNSLGKRLGNKASSFDMDEMWNQIQERRTPKKDRRLIWIPILMLATGVASFLVYQVLSDEANTQVLNQKSPTVILEKHEQSINSVAVVEEEKNVTIEPIVISQEQKNVPRISMREQKENRIQFDGKQKMILESNSKEHKNELQFSYNESEKDTKILSSQLHHIELMRSLELQEKLVTIPNFDFIPNINAKVEFEHARSLVLKDNMTTIFQAKTNHKNNTQRPIYFGAEFSYGIAQRNFKAHEIGVADWLELRDENEKMLDQFSGALNMRFSLANGFYFHTGLEYQQYTAKLNTQVYNFSSEIKVDTVSILVDSEGLILSATEDEVLVQNSTISSYTRFQKYRSIAVPLFIGKNFNFSNKSTISINTGLLIALSTFNDGVVQKSTSSPSEFEDVIQIGYDRKMFLQSNFSAEYHYFFAKRSSVFCGVNIRADLSNRSNLGLSFSDKFSSYNLKLGWMKAF